MAQALGGLTQSALTPGTLMSPPWSEDWSETTPANDSETVMRDKSTEA